MQLDYIENNRGVVVSYAQVQLRINFYQFLLLLCTYHENLYMVNARKQIRYVQFMDFMH